MLEFVLNKPNKEIAVAEIDVIVGSGKFVGEKYYVDTIYKTNFDKLAFTKEIYENDRKISDLNKKNKFESRRAHLLPAGHPAMTHPRVARAMVNLSGAVREVLDPFCGAGGILIEAGLCGLKATGFDIDKKSLFRAEKNLKHLGIKNCEIVLQDATTFTGKYEAVVTDLPYGKNTKVTDELEKFYLAFLNNVQKNGIKKIVVGFLSDVDYLGIVARAGF